MIRIAEVALPLPLENAFFYAIPESLGERAKIGSRVLVSFGPRLLTGFIVGLKKHKKWAGPKLKEIREVQDEKPIFLPSFLSFTRKLSAYYHAPWGEILQASLPPPFVLKSQKRVAITEKGRRLLQDSALAKDERGILTFLQKKSYSIFYLKRALKIKNLPSRLGRLQSRGCIDIEESLKSLIPRKNEDFSSYPAQLEIDFSLDIQTKRVAESIAKTVGTDRFSPFYLYGSSEKRGAVYFHLIKKALSSKKKVLFLVPEISLTQNLAREFAERLGGRASVIHSQLSEKKRTLEWKKIQDARVDAVIGPRSALLSPIENLGLVIVDEEQDESYYQRESPSYDARKGAWMRARLERAVLICGSSAPPVESFHKAKKRGYLISLEKKQEARQTKIVEHRGGKNILSPHLKERIRLRMIKKEPLLIFFNRRGFAPFLICSKCQAIPRCQRCDIALSFHKGKGKLVCHYCNFSLPMTGRCLECGSLYFWKRGFGVEAVEEELKKHFPLKKIACFATDGAGSKGKQEEIRRKWVKGEIDILIGTQLLAGQTDMPKAHFAAVLYPEDILFLSDFQASQKVFQSIHHIGEFLFDDPESELFIQTANPQHFSIQYASQGDYDSFYKQELKYRKLLNYPPFSCMAEVLFSGENLRTLGRKTREFSSITKGWKRTVDILGPALAAVSKVRGRYRVQMILKTKKRKDLEDLLEYSLPRIHLKKTIRFYE